MRNRIQAQTVQFFMRFSGLTLVGLCAWQGSPSLKWIASTSAALAQGTGAIPPPPDEGAPDDADMTPPPAPSSASGASSSSVITPGPKVGTQSSAEKSTSVGTKSGDDVPGGKAIPGKAVPPGRDVVSIDFPEPVAIKDIIKAVSGWTGKTFITNHQDVLNTKIQILSPKQSTKEEAFQAFLSALSMAGFTVVESGQMAKIVPIKNVSGANIKTFYGSSWAPLTDNYITQIVPLKYVDCQMLATQLKPIVGNKVNMVPFPPTNALIFTATGNEIYNFLQIINLLDVPGNQPQVAIIPLKYTDAKEVASKVDQIFGGSRGSGGSSMFLQRSLVDERTNSMMLVGAPRALDDVARLVRRLDKPLDDQSVQAQIHVRPLEYAQAERVAKTLSDLTSGAKQNNRPSFAPKPSLSGGANGGGIASVAELGGVKITADASTNSLIIQGSKAAFKELDTIIKMLDMRRPQAYIEADIMDVNVGNDFKFNVSVLAGAKVGNNAIPLGWRPSSTAPFIIDRGSGTSATDMTNLVQAIPSAALLGLIGGSAQNKVTVGVVNLSPGAFIFALKNDSNANVLQTPSMLVADNEKGHFQIVDQEIIETVEEDPLTKLRRIKPSPIEATLSLDITPQISKSSNDINLNLAMRADSFGRRNDKSQPVQINKRESSTQVNVQDDQTVVISGLTREVDIVGEGKVPLLGDIPILGWLFRDKSTSKQKTNLTIFITPHIIRGPEDLEKVYKRKIKERDEFLSAFYGSKFADKDVFARLRTEKDGTVKASPKPAEIVPPPKPAEPAPEEPKEEPILAPMMTPSGVAPASPAGGGAGVGNGMSSGGLPPPPPPPSSGGFEGTGGSLDLASPPSSGGQGDGSGANQ